MRRPDYGERVYKHCCDVVDDFGAGRGETHSGRLPSHEAAGLSE
jgi:hypothetical protein